MSFQIKIEPTERGFMRGEFKDGDGNACVIQDSSLATDYMVRLGQLEGNHHLGHCLATMHLTKEMARTLIQALMRFVNNGSIAEIDLAGNAEFAQQFGLYVELTAERDGLRKQFHTQAEQRDFVGRLVDNMPHAQIAAEFKEFKAEVADALTTMEHALRPDLFRPGFYEAAMEIIGVTREQLGIAPGKDGVNG